MIVLPIPKDEKTGECLGGWLWLTSDVPLAKFRPVRGVVQQTPSQRSQDAYTLRTISREVFPDLAPVCIVVLHPMRFSKRPRKSDQYNKSMVYWLWIMEVYDGSVRKDGDYKLQEADC